MHLRRRGDDRHRAAEVGRAVAVEPAADDPRHHAEQEPDEGAKQRQPDSDGP